MKLKNYKELKELLKKTSKNATIFLNEAGDFIINDVNCRIFSTNKANMQVSITDVKKALDLLKNIDIAITDNKINFIEKNKKVGINFSSEAIEIPDLKEIEKAALNDVYTDYLFNLKSDIENSSINQIILNKSHIAATDSYRLGVYQVKLSLKDDVLIPFDIVKFITPGKNIVKVFNDKIQILTAGSITIEFKKVTHHFPDYKQVLKNYVFTQKADFKNTLVEALKNIKKVAADKKDKYAFNLTIDKNTAVLETQASITYSDTLKIKSNIKQFKRLNSNYLLDGLKRVDNDNLFFIEKNYHTPISVRDKNYIYILMPLKEIEDN